MIVFLIIILCYFCCDYVCCWGHYKQWCYCC
jgi:hypothetical protein